jgi:SAM-dependent methyltransferase
MSLAHRFDERLRRSAAARFIPQLRRRVPRLYGFVRGLIDRAAPLGSQHGLARHQARAVADFCRLCELRELPSPVLEIGSDFEGRVLRELLSRGAASVVGINPAFAASAPDEETVRALAPAGTLQVGDVRDLDFQDGELSAIFSVSVFEHLEDLGSCLREMHRVLRPGGCVYADFGPIWSCSVGHHVYATADGLEARHFKPETNPVPNHAHLLRTRAELAADLRDAVPGNLLDAILEWIYDGPGINRLLFEDYLRAFEESELEMLLLETDDEHVNGGTLAELRQRYPGYERFDVRNAKVMLRKS